MYMNVIFKYNLYILFYLSVPKIHSNKVMNGYKNKYVYLIIFLAKFLYYFFFPLYLYFSICLFSLYIFFLYIFSLL